MMSRGVVSGVQSIGSIERGVTPLLLNPHPVDQRGLSLLRSGTFHPYLLRAGGGSTGPIPGATARDCSSRSSSKEKKK